MKQFPEQWGQGVGSEGREAENGEAGHREVHSEKPLQQPKISQCAIDLILSSFIKPFAEEQREGLVTEGDLNLSRSCPVLCNKQPIVLYSDFRQAHTSESPGDLVKTLLRAGEVAHIHSPCHKSIRT